MPDRDRRRDVLFLVLAAACWGVGTVVSKQAVAELPPLTLLTIQLAVSVAALVVVTRIRGERMPAGREGRLLGRLGLLNPGVAYALSLIGLAEITASLSVLVWATEPIFILALAALVLGERIGPTILVATAIALVGLALVVLDPSASGSALGITLTVSGVIACAVYTVATRKWLLGSDSTFGVVLAQQAHALAFALVALAILAVAGRAVTAERVSASALASAAASGLLYYTLAYFFYLSALRNVRASVAAASFYLIPVFGIAVAGLFGERFAAMQWVGAALVIASVAIITIRSSRPVRAEPAPAGAD